MTNPFTPPSPGEAVTVSEAYELADEPKPSVEAVQALIRRKEITAARNEYGFWCVPSLDQFNDELNDWKQRTNWNPGRGGATAYNVMPEGYAGLLAWCREHVARDEGRSKRLFDSAEPPMLASRVRVLLGQGDLPSARPVTSTLWAAPPHDIKVWLHRRFGINAR